MPDQRSLILDKIRHNGAFDVVVVGGGINGIGVFRELALQGLKVLLVERSDFCSGCSAAPSRMIHGGLRYLENGEFGLVQESLRERDALLANAPHMVRPLPTTIPIRTVFSGLMNGAAGFLGLSEAPSSRGALAIKAGLALYDWTTRKRRVLPRHKFRGARTTFAQWPALDPKLRFSATYYDAWISYPERLGIELLLDAGRLAPDSLALNRAQITRAGSAFELTDMTTDERFPVSAKAIVNATGAWIDSAIARLDASEKPLAPLVEGTKGSHLILDNEPLYQALGGHMIFFENADGRICIMFPYLGKVLVGSTDIRVSEASRVRCEPAEADYILAAARLVFPAIPVHASDVVFTYSGIRPLPKSDHAFTGRISRGHSVHRIAGDIPQFCMIGGKWTTFRAFAEQAADAVLAELGRERLCGTLTMPIGGGLGFPGDPASLAADLAGEFALSGDRAAYLVDRYGSGARDIALFCVGRPDDIRLDGRTETTAAEIVYLIRHEFVTCLSDLVLRRTSLAICGDISMATIERIADALAAERGWSDRQRVGEVQSLVVELDTYHGVSQEMLDQRTISGAEDEGQRQGPHEPDVHQRQLPRRGARSRRLQ
ncbi:glycerol-3-phosphate dehydrogenase/oxidase [Mesorhizobium sp. M4B.F.Ca.ET.215.01.1.1]|uniref:glycerol-3-phosphate dehydrogenase/oxidase n=4 Tax=Mesorhizobium TaxID=68287 RepID=UPI000FD4477C|nr:MULTISPECIES: glycerol-3-phosphate dehydrogenase/oxidase [unclassified Mesorhizobium]RUW28301.1 glycerol-3-phosphate dehydrogenase/oxidase [Mesorhizobium sp. M4B.F.Ca.ET.013.02.1.1]TGQ10702.1 glycerol-3-phosphate dehydrogenase/oxidase [Mesorhizobium sp. M4B.F.Ca.ET.215.01.1.1]TGQ36272.1 glycerol-3-phosphate dehydrogenase/oxidase [Mesorhizobium sp. M4B.F.Ca.ET.214.01.1.1]TGQ38206.1 glycerol-3-phosphate dehydrogenase/oxidase [Mesorhizobium sp. M00.F.Ca.ET.220.01.1.1]TGQ59074.1 glycerol-3-phos